MNFLNKVVSNWKQKPNLGSLYPFSFLIPKKVHFCSCCIQSDKNLCFKDFSFPNQSEYTQKQSQKKKPKAVCCKNMKYYRPDKSNETKKTITSSNSTPFSSHQVN